MSKPHRLCWCTGASFPCKAYSPGGALADAQDFEIHQLARRGMRTINPHFSQPRGEVGNASVGSSLERRSHYTVRQSTLFNQPPDGWITPPVGLAEGCSLPPDPVSAFAVRRGGAGSTGERRIPESARGETFRSTGS